MTTTTLTSGYVSFASTISLSSSTASVVYAAVGSNPTLANAGTLKAIGTANDVLSFAGAGTVINTTGTMQGPQYFGGAGAFFENSSGVVTGVGGTHGGRIDFNNGGTFNFLGATHEYINLYAANGAAYLENAGSVITDQNPVGFYAGGTVFNVGTIQTTLGNAVVIDGAPATITNQGYIAGNHTGIEVGGAPAYITNNGGVISGFRAIYLTGPATVTNGKFGKIIGGTTGSGAGSGTGLIMKAGGTLTNSATATISGVYGVHAATAAATVFNYGAISGAAQGVVLDSGGTITNGGTISGEVLASGVVYVANQSSGTFYSTAGNAFYLLGFGASVRNAGTILATNGNGVRDAFGGVVTNAASGTITGSGGGVVISGGAGTVTNYGVIRGTTQYGVFLLSGGAVTNSGTASGIVGGAAGVYVKGGEGTVVNEGIIAEATLAVSGSHTAAIYLQTGGTITNSGSAAYIYGTVGISAGASGATTIDNQGTIASGATYAIYLNDGGSILNSLQITGAVDFQGTASNTLDNLQGATIQASGARQVAVYANGAAYVSNAGAILGPSAGVRLTGGGTVTNQPSGVITGYHGIQVSGGVASVANQGTITGTGGGYAVDVFAGGSVTNAAAGVIVGGYDGIFSNGVGSVDNAGAITGSTASGIYLYAGGSVTNSDSHALIFGGKYGVASGTGASLAVVNFGSIVSGGADVIRAVGTVTNHAGGNIFGALNGVSLGDGSTLENAGRIYGSTHAAVLGTASLLVIDPGAHFYGVDNTSVGSVTAGSASTVELKSAAGAGSLADVGGLYAGFAQVSVDNGAAWTIGSIAAAAAVTASGGALTISGAIDAGASFDLASTGAGETLALLGVPGTTITNTISNFSVNDVIVLPGSGFTAAVLTGGNTLNVYGAGHSLAFLLTNFSTASGSVGHLVAGSDFVEMLPCFRAGTHMATPSGDVAVERLAAGDRVVTRDGVRRVRWVGERRLDCRRHSKPTDVLPVRVRAHAFGPNAPRRDLFLSPDHAVFVADASGGGALVPVRGLLNGASIAQVAVPEVWYLHLELEAHGVVFAEGLACESYLDTGNRSAFAAGSDSASANAARLPVSR